MDKCRRSLKTINSALLSLERDLVINRNLLTYDDILRRVRDMGNLASSTLNQQDEIEMINISLNGGKNNEWENY